MRRVAVPLSYVVTRDLRIHVMVHVPTGKTSLFQKLYKYIPTPMSFLENGTHFLANPAEPKPIHKQSWGK